MGAEDATAFEDVVVEDAVVTTVLDAGVRFASERVEYIAAVRPAPVAALTAAMIARVDLDMMAWMRQSDGFVLWRQQCVYDLGRLSVLHVRKSSGISGRYLV